MTQVCPRASQIWDQPSSQPLKFCEEARSSHVLAYSLSGFPMATMLMKLRVHSEMKAHGQYSEVYFPFHVSKFMGRYPLVPKHNCSQLGYLCQLQTNNGYIKNILIQQPFRKTGILSIEQSLKPYYMTYCCSSVYFSMLIYPKHDVKNESELFTTIWT